MSILSSLRISFKNVRMQNANQLVATMVTKHNVHRIYINHRNKGSTQVNIFVEYPCQQWYCQNAAMHVGIPEATIGNFIIHP